MSLIEVRNVSKVYEPASACGRSLLRGGIACLTGQKKREPHVALDSISLTVSRGESLGIIGANGSGKSTLLRILAGITSPTTGEVVVRGRVVPLLELGAGFHPLLTGRENIYLNARILGMSRAETEAVYDRIVAFSGLDQFMDTAVTTYSSGMYVRLGFAVAAHSNPDIFLIDEVLAVGDEDFQRKCRRRIAELREQGKTIVFVSHDLGIVHTLCDRVLLLAGGRMIVRPTPRETIAFYLRQVGRAQGIHAFGAGRTEAIFNHGQVSVFQNGHEVTAPEGIQASFLCMEQEYHARAAEWDVLERKPAGCTAAGRMARLPVIQEWRFMAEPGRLIWAVAANCIEDVPIHAFKAVVHLPTRYTSWIYGDYEGTFPDIVPEDTTWSPVVSPEESSPETTALPAKDADVPLVTVTVDSRYPYAYLAWCNTDYATGTRVLVILIRFPDSASTFAAGRHEIMTAVVDLTRSYEETRERARKRADACALDCEAFRARFHRGRIRLRHGREDLTAAIHAYFSMLIGGLWHDSFQLKWDIPVRSAHSLEVIGHSRRFPMRQKWRMDATPEGLLCVVRVEACEPMDVDEYHFSVCLRPDYDQWETDHERGSFPPFHTDSDQWRHLNRVYESGRRITARSPLRPTLTLEIASDTIPFRMTALNTDFRLEARVLQALRTSEGKKIYLEKGWHTLFEGLIRLG